MKILPHLIDYAIRRRPDYLYTDLTERVGDDLSPHCGMNHVLGYIRDEICGTCGLPYLTAIVIDKNKGLPGTTSKYFAYYPDQAGIPMH